MIIGIAPADHLDSELGHLQDWLANGYNGAMAWLARDVARRCDPRKVMPGCKSVIVCAMKYDEMPNRTSCGNSPCFPPLTKGGEGGFIPKYLQHKDYHIVMREKLEELATEIKKEHPAAECRCYVDTWPVMEKAWGRRAGLGFIGKNTLFISPEHGSQLALGVVLTSYSSSDAELVEAESRSQIGSRLSPSINSGLRSNSNSSACGSCTACLSACPTGALVAPYTLDARKCISYKFFIEKKIGGCDVCQSICPYNK